MRKRLLQKKIAVALAAGVFFSAGQVRAAENETFQLDEVIVTANRISQTVSDTPANVTVITGAELQSKGARTLADALTGVTGVIVKSYGGSGQKALPYIFGTDRVVVLVDGKRVNLPQGIGAGSGGVDLNTVIIDNIERIEVVHGGASTLYGSDAVGGVINIVTKKGSARTMATMSGGNYGDRYYAIDTGGQENKTHWRLSGVRDNNEGQRPNSAYKGKNLSFRLDRDLAKGENLTFTYDFYGRHAGLPGSISRPTPHDFQDILRHNWSLGYVREHTDGIRMFRYYDNDQIYSGENYGGFRHQNTVRAFEYQDSARLNTDNLLTWGGEWREGKVVSTSEGNTPHDDIIKAVYVQNQYSLNSAATMTFGLRRDDSTLYGTHWLPQAAFLYRINDRTSYFANWAKVFKAPKFDDLYGDDGRGNTGNPNLTPETGWTAETGIKTKLSSDSEMTLSLFTRDITDAIRWVEASDHTKHPRNIDQLKTKGVNISFTARLSPAATADFGYTYMDSQDQTGDNIGDPKNSFHIGLNIHDSRWTQAICGIYQDKTGVTTSQVGSRFIVNMNTSYAINKDTTSFLTINNLFDKQYQSVKGYPANGRTVLFGVRQELS